MADYLLGLDYGTGGAKACIINPEGEVLGFAFEEYPFFHDKPGWSEHDAMGYCRIARESGGDTGDWGFICTALHGDGR